MRRKKMIKKFIKAINKSIVLQNFIKELRKASGIKKGGSLKNHVYQMAMTLGYPAKW